MAAVRALVRRVRRWSRLQRRWLIANALCGSAALLGAGHIVWTLTAPWPGPPVPATPLERPPVPPPPEPRRPGDYAAVAAHNLFSPTRSETAPAPAPVTAPPPAPTPFLLGVIVQDETPVAYLQDPVTRRVARYRIGDAIAGGTLESIAADRVVLRRGQGPVAVLLHDPGKPRESTVAATPTVPWAPGPTRAPGPSAVGSAAVQPPARPAAPPRVLPHNFRKHVAAGTGRPASQ